MMLLKIFLASVTLATCSFLWAKQVEIGAKGIYSGLLAVIAVGIFGLICREELGDNRVGAATIGIAVPAFFIAFILADNALIGHEKMSAILLSFIAVGIIGLTTIKKNHS